MDGEVMYLGKVLTAAVISLSCTTKSLRIYRPILLT